ncbi:MAG: hypothetical protein LBR05_00940 [Azoarcus sp.]|jgi:hypothetical protein|nr:hypothetical protein [Azoarcus sp.]
MTAAELIASLQEIPAQSKVYIVQAEPQDAAPCQNLPVAMLEVLSVTPAKSCYYGDAAILEVEEWA